MRKKINLFSTILMAIMSLNSFAQNRQITNTLLGGNVYFSAVMDNDSITVTLQGPDDKWFAVGFGSNMINTDAIIYSEGKSGTETQNLQDYYLTATNANAVNADTEQDWRLISNTTSGNVRTIQAIRELDTENSDDYAFSTTASSLNLIWAQDANTSFQLQNHGGNRGNSTLTWNNLGPELASSSPLYPVNGATNVLFNNQLIVNFDENITAGSGYIGIYGIDGRLIENIGVTSNAVVITDNQVVITPNYEFESTTTYYVQIPSTAFKNSSNYYFSGIYDASTWRFRTFTSREINTTALGNDLYFQATQGRDSITTTITAPNDRWFSVGFGTEMINSDVLIYGSGTSENPLSVQLRDYSISNGQTPANILLDTEQDWRSVENTNTQSQRIITARRALNTGNSTDIEVSTANPDLNIIWAHGTSPSFNITYHGANRGASIFTWDTKTGTAPELSTIDPIYPTLNSIIDDLSENLTIRFTRVVTKGTGNIYIFKESGDLVETIDVTDNTVNISYNKVTINPVNDLENGTRYYIRIAETAFTETTGNNFTGINDNSTWAFSTIDNLAPVLASTNPLTPENNAQNVNLTSDFQIRFSETITKGTGNIRFYLSGGVLIESINVSSNDITVSENLASINPSLNLDPNTSYYILVEQGVFQDESGNDFEGINSTTDWVFTSDNNLPPTTATSSPFTPANNSSDIDIMDNFTVRFSENILIQTGNIILYKTNGTLVETIDVTSSLVTVNGTEVTINPTANLESTTSYYILMDVNTFRDVDGNNFAGISNSSTWTFTTQDVAGPMLTNTPFAPQNGATDIAIDSNFDIYFNENISKGTGNIKLYHSNGTVIETIDVTSNLVTISGVKATINPINELGSKINYYILVDAGAFTDFSNNTFSGITDATTWTFTTVDFTAPLTASTNPFIPANSSTNFNTSDNLVINFNENMNKASGNIELYNADGTVHETIDINSSAVVINNYAVSINPTTNLLSETGYYIRIDAGALTDLAGNAFAGILDNSTWAFTTVDVLAPTFMATNALTPADNATAVGISDNFIIRFNENINKGTGKIYIYQPGGVVSEIIPVTSDAVSVTDNVVTINPVADLNSTSMYYIQIDATAFTDISGNNFIGINSNTKWDFTTRDDTPPTYESSIPLEPANGATNVGLRDDLIINFSEDIVKGTGNVTIFQDNVAIQTINVTTPAVRTIGNGAVINPPVSFELATTYTIQVDATAFVDTAGNSFTGITDHTTWSFTTTETNGIHSSNINLYKFYQNDKEIRFYDFPNNTEVKLYSLNGQLINEWIVSGYDTHKTDFIPEGLYVLQIKSNNSTHIQKLIIE